MFLLTCTQKERFLKYLKITLDINNFIEHQYNNNHIGYLGY